ncbi:hypothetical protein GGS23DRAFT_518994 [Durotheca rogersii]|uniref:uncharacterized protein n=1 Tax=Durotheca rogersii TaxID=419775 RepID=UPI002220922A|nr:uncharacterized protein GGS23DRAFT_518994 [Durotheca rogersii]KAI5863896.1 hypothetical protein GGS23DRAFT_518994 [Durotheca rogersii]
MWYAYVPVIICPYDANEGRFALLLDAAGNPFAIFVACRGIATSITCDFSGLRIPLGRRFRGCPASPGPCPSSPLSHVHVLAHVLVLVLVPVPLVCPPAPIAGLALGV